MPLQFKRSREEVKTGYTPAPKKERKKKIGYNQDQVHALFKEIPSSLEHASSLIGQMIVSFLNSSGGICAFGVGSTGIVYGDLISRHEEDVLKCTIDECVKRTIPSLRCDQYRVKFTPVMEKTHFNQKQVLEIKVNPGDAYKLYEDQHHKVYIRRGCMTKGPLTPHEIKDITTKQLTERENIMNPSKAPSQKEPGRDSKESGRDPKESGRDSKEPGRDPKESGRDPKESGDALKHGLKELGDGHKALVRRALAEKNLTETAGRNKLNPVVISSGDSDQEAPLPRLNDGSKPLSGSTTLSSIISKEPVTKLVETKKFIKSSLSLKTTTTTSSSEENKTNLKSNVKSRVESNANTKSLVESNASTKSLVESNASTKSLVESNASTKSRVESNASTKSRVESNASTKSRVESNASTKSRVDFKVQIRSRTIPPHQPRLPKVPRLSYPPPSYPPPHSSYPPPRPSYPPHCSSHPSYPPPHPSHPPHHHPPHPFHGYSGTQSSVPLVRRLPPHPYHLTNSSYYSALLYNRGY